MRVWIARRVLVGSLNNGDEKWCFETFWHFYANYVNAKTLRMQSLKALARLIYWNKQLEGFIHKYTGYDRFAFTNPVTMAHPFEQQRDSSRRILYLKGSWRGLFAHQINNSLGRQFVPYALFRAWTPYLPGLPSLSNSTRLYAKIFDEASDGIL